MQLQREIIIRNNGQVELKPTTDDPKSRFIDHSKSLELLGRVITECDEDFKPRMITIEGAADSGKSILAELLTETGNDTVLVRAGTKVALPEKIGLPPIEDKSATFIFDEPNFVTDQSLQDYCSMIAQEKGVVVLLAQKIAEYECIITPDTVKLELTQAGLKRI